MVYRPVQLASGYQSLAGIGFASGFLVSLDGFLVSLDGFSGWFLGFSGFKCRNLFPPLLHIPISEPCARNV